MPTKTCTKCDFYSFPLRRCTLGKVNPRTFKQVKDTADIMGTGYICDYNKFKERLLKGILDKHKNLLSFEV